MITVALASVALGVGTWLLPLNDDDEFTFAARLMVPICILPVLLIGQDWGLRFLRWKGIDSTGLRVATQAVGVLAVLLLTAMFVGYVGAIASGSEWLHNAQSRPGSGIACLVYGSGAVGATVLFAIIAVVVRQWDRWTTRQDRGQVVQSSIPAAEESRG